MSVERSTHIEGGDRVVTVTREYATELTEVWPSLVDPDGIGAWVEPVEGDLHEGGRYLLKQSGTSGTVVSCARHEGFTVTWEYEGDVSRVTVSLAEAGDGTRLSLSHAAAEGDHWRTYGPAAAAGAGWEEMLHALAVHLGEATAIEDEAAFVRESTAAWAEADAAAGTDEATARARAERTTAFYLGEA